MATEAEIQARCDEILTTYRTTDIKHYPYVSGAVDVYKQRTKTFGTSVTLVGRAIHKPTKEVLTIIGDGEEYEIAFLFSRLEMNRKYPSATEGEWISTDDQMWWRERRYKIERVAPTGQIGNTFSLLAIVANSIEGQRDP